jgi:flavin reductase (DIM6/NTAB) family NADH-FMN oxidoreductase RutF
MKKELPASNRLQPGPAGVVVMATCIDFKGKPNIITLGMYMPISSNPPLVCIGVAPQRYSHRLIKESGEFVVNTPSIILEKKVDFCGSQSGRDIDKFAATGLTPIPSLKVKPPRIKECFGHLECRVMESHECGDHTLFVGEVVASSVDEEVMNGETLDILTARPIVQKNHVYFTTTKQRDS